MYKIREYTPKNGIRYASLDSLLGNKNKMARFGHSKFINADPIVANSPSKRCLGPKWKAEREMFSAPVYLLLSNIRRS